MQPLSKLAHAPKQASTVEQAKLVTEKAIEAEEARQEPEQLCGRNPLDLRALRPSGETPARCRKQSSRLDVYSTSREPAPL